MVLRITSMPPLFQPASILFESPIVNLYGAGKVGREVQGILTRHGWKVGCYFDRSQTLWENLDELPVYSPDQHLITAEEKEIPIIISIFNRDADIVQIARRLSELGFSRIITFPDFHNLFPNDLGDRFWLTKRSYYRQHAEEIEKASRLWFDEESTQLFRILLQFRLDPDYFALPEPSEEVAYFPGDLNHWPPKVPLRFVDCGAYHGDTIHTLNVLNFPVEAIAAFEPDPQNFQGLVKNIQSLQTIPSGGVSLWPCGVSSQTGLQKFSGGAGEASRINIDGDRVISCVALDDALTGFRPNLLKMDIEGSELRALNGAKKLIVDNRPALAICLYHAPDHLWKIPLLIQSWNLTYKFSMRLYSYNCFDVVFYANPGDESNDRT